MDLTTAYKIIESCHGFDDETSAVGAACAFVKSRLSEKELQECPECDSFLERGDGQLWMVSICLECGFVKKEDGDETSM